MSIERLASLPSDVEGRDPFEFRIGWIEDRLLVQDVRVTWTEIPTGLVFDFPITWREDGLDARFRITWREEPEDLEDAYDRDPQLIYARMTTDVEEG